MPPRAHHSLIPHWLIHFGALGLFAVAVVDSSPIPLPLPGSTDLLLLWLVSHRDEPWLLTASAVVGSIIGGYMSWKTGCKGGERILAQYQKRRVFGRISGWMKDHSLAAVLLPAALPPPIPTMPFLLAAGALGISRTRFLTAFGVGRTLRFAFVSWLAMRYGRHIVGLWNKSLQRWSSTVLWVFLAITVVGVCVGVWRMRSQRNSDHEPDEPASALAVHGDC